MKIINEKIDKLFAYMSRMLGINILVAILVEHRRQSDLLLVKSDIIIKQNQDLLAALKAINIETLIDQNHKIVSAIGNTPATQSRTQKELGIVPESAICSVCDAHVARFTVVDGKFVCANCLKG